MCGGGNAAGGAGGAGGNGNGGGDGDGSNGGLGSNANGLGSALGGIMSGGYGGGPGSQGSMGAGGEGALGSGFGTNNSFSRAVDAVGLRNATAGGWGSGMFDTARPQTTQNAMPTGWGMPEAEKTEMTAQAQALAQSLALAGFAPEAYSIQGLGDEERNKSLGNYAEAQIVKSQISPTMRQSLQGFITGQNFSPSIPGLAEAIAKGATQTDLAQGYNSGNLGSNEQGQVTADVLGQLSTMAAPFTSIISPVKMAMLAALGAPKQAIMSAPGIPSTVPGLANLAKSVYGLTNLAAANRALGGTLGGTTASSLGDSSIGSGNSDNTTLAQGTPNTTARATLASLGDTNTPASGFGWGPWSGYAPGYSYYG